ncbi:fe2+ zn2+ uptake regulation protein [Pseudomonas gingeri]|uniref:Fe2+ zn2+ uptake regulation protein n=1 Tax=Pseudomonas gingeri TaxID=117681 RepID=A0A7Y7XHM3_9PSED|nr:fe2+ zn2+ uptake regulation protein [Pseudomonas gingeri]NWA28018.1 fe2+ zn2+ uptake regulation protein [Pseudomonas gingeri]NWB99982.1 fe2+ zn2+ uptake regulation protein [Pseudomonas gingeri]NWD70091.1 fe2+ zn2+ uptake regulation protein [Pseudomonas gingeri]NWD75472.1 fe2+ zn2+ uptake regulation protein [Pseudomonas gingeri]
MYDQHRSTDGNSLQRDPSYSSGAMLAKPAERGSNSRIRQLLKHFGLRTSLIRLKVIDALLSAGEDNRRLGVRGVHSHLLELGIPLSFLSVREVLKRLCSEGVVVLNADKSYSLHPDATATLELQDSEPQATGLDT